MDRASGTLVWKMEQKLRNNEPSACSALCLPACWSKVQIQPGLPLQRHQHLSKKKNEVAASTASRWAAPLQSRGCLRDTPRGPALHGSTITAFLTAPGFPLDSCSMSQSRGRTCSSSGRQNPGGRHAKWVQHLCGPPQALAAGAWRFCPHQRPHSVGVLQPSPHPHDPSHLGKLLHRLDHHRPFAAL